MREPQWERILSTGRQSRDRWVHRQDGNDFVCEKRNAAPGTRDIVYSIRTGVIPTRENAGLIDAAPLLADLARDVERTFLSAQIRGYDIDQMRLAMQALRALAQEALAYACIGPCPVCGGTGYSMRDAQPIGGAYPIKEASYCPECVSCPK